MLQQSPVQAVTVNDPGGSTGLHSGAGLRGAVAAGWGTSLTNPTELKTKGLCYNLLTVVNFPLGATSHARQR